MKKTGLIKITQKVMLLVLAILLISSYQVTTNAQDSKDVDLLVKELKSADPVLRAKAACQLGRLGRGATKAIPALLELLGDDSPVDPKKLETWGYRMRWSSNKGPQPTSPGFEAANALGNMGKAAVAPLTEKLKDSSWFVRMNAADALGDIEDPAAYNPLVAALKKEIDVEAKIEMIDAISDFEDQRSLEVLASFCDDPVVEVRLEALWGLEDLENESAAPYFLAALRDVEPKVREAGIWGLEEFENEKYFDAFLKATKDKDKKVRFSAYEALSDLESPKSEGLFLGLVNDSDPRLVLIAVDALGDMESRKAVPELLKLINNKDKKIRISAIYALGDIGDKSAAIALSRLVEVEKDSEVKRIALEAISDLY
jgi:HEAT repeat protein